MQTITREVGNDWILVSIETGEASPMLNHLFGEIAADDQHRVFYVYELHARTIGTDSLLKACRQYGGL